MEMVAGIADDASRCGTAIIAGGVMGVAADLDVVAFAVARDVGVSAWVGHIAVPWARLFPAHDEAGNLRHDFLGGGGAGDAGYYIG